MEDYTKFVLRKICCMCLSVDRKLSQLCKLEDGVNNLFFLLSSDSEAYKAMFSRDATHLFICWECDSLMRRQRKFRDQVCIAQKQLCQIVDEQVILKPQNSLSKLTRIHRNSYDKEFIFNDNVIDNFIDCGPVIKGETEPNIPIIDIDNELASISDDDMTDIIDEINVIDNKIEIKPLSTNKRKLKKDINKRVSIKRKVKKESTEQEEENYSDKIVLENKVEVKILSLKNRKLKNEINKRKVENELDNKIGIEPLSINKELKNEMNKRKVKSGEECIKEEGFSRIRMTEGEMIDSIEKRKLENDYINALNKCKSCVEVFKDQIELEEHNTRLHVQKPKFIQCDICLVYIKFWWLPDHRKEHHLKYQCHFCNDVYYTLIDMLVHLKNIHSMRNALSPGVMKKLKRKAMLTNPVLAPKKKDASDGDGTNEESNLGFKCSDCNKYFENRYLRYKHILKLHREGHKCATCGKTFAFKNTLNKHEQIHGAPQPMEQCPTCGKMVRSDRVVAHARIHAARATFECVACDKRFVSRDSYEKHLKYSSSHAVTDVHKYKCTMCEKGFRTMREMNDHVNYNHMGKTLYKCPICHKALATRRCVTRHVSRAHHGIKEKSGDKILCQTCGKAFRDKKCLREHELIHTGEKPLACDMCGRTFRQSACLYTHRRRVHKVAPKRLLVQHAGAEDVQDKQTEIH